MTLANKVALITGGSKGLGLALAHELGRSGAKVAVVARHRAELAEAVAGLEAAGICALGIEADVGDQHAVYGIVGQVQALLGPVDILIHNASTLGPTPLRLLADTDCEELSRTLEVNVLGPFRLNKALVPGMLVRGHGVLVHISSDAAVNAYPSWGAYGTSKAALDQLARQFAAELTETAVRVLTVDPGEMDTDMHRAALPTADRHSLASPSTVARRIVRLLQEPGSYAHGARIVASEVEISS
jgi:NAD(P)-dependent dehydrogenase (short-subunit alcohol dehydrogenase family)